MKQDENLRDNRTTSRLEDREIEQLLQQAGPRPGMPQDDLRLVEAAARSEWATLVDSRGARRTGFPLLATAGAVAALLLALGVTWWMGQPESADSPPEVAILELVRGEVRVGTSTPVVGSNLDAGLGIRTGADAKWAKNVAALRLPAGHSVRLRSGTRARLLSSLRLELLAGAVYVDSGPNPAPRDSIAIVTPYGTVVDVGTQFEVRVGESAEAIRVRVRSGSVSISADRKTQSAGAGEELRVLEDGSVRRASFTLSAEDWDWILSAAPAIDIEGLRLTAFLDWVRAETGWSVVFEDEVLADIAETIELHGSIEGLRPDEAVRVVLPGSGLGHRVDDDVLHIERLPGDGDGI